VVPVGLEPTTL